MSGTRLFHLHFNVLFSAANLLISHEIMKGYAQKITFYDVLARKGNWKSGKFRNLGFGSRDLAVKRAGRPGREPLVRLSEGGLRKKHRGR